MTDFSLDGAASAEVSDQLWREAAAGAADPNTGRFNTVAAISAADDGQIGALLGQDFRLFERRSEGVTVVWIARKAAHADDKARVQRGGHADLAAEFIAHPRLAFGDAIDLRLVQGVDLVSTLRLLMQELRDQSELGDDPIPQTAFGDVIEVAA
jgi:hypothetical protein